MFKIPNVRDVVSIVTVRVAVMLIVVKSPVLPAPSAMVPPVHLAVLLQTSEPLKFHVPLAAPAFGARSNAMAITIVMMKRMAKARLARKRRLATERANAQPLALHREMRGATGALLERDTARARAI